MVGWVSILFLLQLLADNNLVEHIATPSEYGDESAYSAYSASDMNTLGDLSPECVVLSPPLFPFSTNSRLTALLRSTVPFEGSRPPSHSSVMYLPPTSTDPHTKKDSPFSPSPIQSVHLFWRPSLSRLFRWLGLVSNLSFLVLSLSFSLSCLLK